MHIHCFVNIGDKLQITSCALILQQTSALCKFGTYLLTYKLFCSPHFTNGMLTGCFEEHSHLSSHS